MIYLRNLIDNIVNPIIYFLFAVALLYFLFGVLVFIKNADDESARETGKKHIFWGIIGLFIMVSVYGIISIVVGTVGADVPTNLMGNVSN
jgi:hypothetical protein